MATEYVCEVTGRKYKTKRGAENSAKRERLLKWLDIPTELIPFVLNSIDLFTPTDIGFMG